MTPHAAPVSLVPKTPSTRRTLTTVERLALRAAQAEYAAAAEQLRALFVELGLDPDRPYRLEGDALVDAGPPAPAE